MADKGFMAPKAGSIRPPTSNSKHHGRVVNPPRYAELGGLSNGGKKGISPSADMTIRKPNV